MSGVYGDLANAIFDYIIFTPKASNLRAKTIAIVNSVDRITDKEIAEWNDTCYAEFISLSRYPEKRYSSKRAQGAFLRRWKKDQHRYVHGSGEVSWHANYPRF